MNEEEKRYLLALSQIEGVGPVAIKNLIAYCGSPKSVFQKSSLLLQQIPEIGPKTAYSITKSDTLKRAEKELEFCQKHNIQIITYLESAFPQALKSEAYLPAILFKKGNIDFNAQPAVSIVGTRKPSNYGKQQAVRFATYLAKKGINVVSGLAYGIDIEVHKAVLAVNGITTAVLGHGLDRIYPEAHSQIASQITENGALLSEYFYGSKPEAANFPHRNRIIAGMSKATIVIESGKKGGAIITAEYAFEQNREVYAVPGNLTSSTSDGCNHLIKDNIAKLITDPEEIFTDLNFETDSQSQLSINQSYDSLSEIEQSIIHCIQKNGVTFDEIATDTQMEMGALMTTLLELELKGIINQLPGRKFELR